MQRLSNLAGAAALAFLASGAFSQGPLVPQAEVRFQPTGPFTPAGRHWSGGTVSVSNPLGGAPIQVQHFGIVWYPSDPAGQLAPSPTPFPLVVFAHGRFQSGSFIGSNHLQATYLLQHLASWGWVVASVNLDVVGQFQNPAAIPQRGELINRTVEHLQTIGGLAPGIDFTRIVYLGHSRGGEGVFAAVQQNPPWAASIRGIGAIAPTNYMSYAVPANAFVLYGAQDGDVNNGWPIQLYDQTSAPDLKGFRLIEGANHFFFTDSIVFSGEGVPVLNRAQHHEIAKTMLATWAGALHYSDPSFRQQIAGDAEVAWSGAFKIHRLYRSSSRITVDDFEQAPFDPFANTLGGANAPAGLTGVAEAPLTTATALSFFHKTRGLVAQWQTPATLDVDLGADLDVAGYPYVSVNVLQEHASILNPVGQDQRFALSLRDGSGNAATIENVELGPLPYPVTATPGFAPKKSVLKTFRFPLAEFVARNPALDLKAARAITLEFNRTPTGEVAIDDFAFTH